MNNLRAVRPIDAEVLYDKLFYRAIEAQGEDECTEETIKECMRLVRDAPTIDAVEVVRCKDCNYFDEAKVNELGFIICRASGMEITENDFCSYGERRSDG